MTDVAAQHTADVDARTEEIFRALGEGSPFVVVDSPPGAGKTELVAKACALFAASVGFRIVCAVPRHNQAVDLVERLARWRGMPPVALLYSESHALPPLPSSVATVSKPGDLTPAHRIVVGTVDKLGHAAGSLSGQFGLLICDEAYQIPMKSFFPIADLSDRCLLVGDPGQLPPLIRTETHDLEAAPNRVHWSVPREVMRRWPGTARFALPASRRLVADTVEIVQPALYPDLPFISSASPQERRVTFGAGGIGGAVDAALDRLALGASMIALRLSGPPPVAGVDHDLLDLSYRVLRRMMDRQVCVGGTPLTSSDIGCLDTHVQPGGALRLRLRGTDLEPIRVDTPEVWQGGERPITVVHHPLSGVVCPSEFDLDPGRLCVMLSRHRAASIIVTRGGVSEVLDAYRHDCGVTASGAQDRGWSGYFAHRQVWTELERRDRFIDVA